MKNIPCRLLALCLCFVPSFAQAALLPWMEEDKADHPYTIVLEEGQENEELLTFLQNALDKNREQLHDSGVDLESRNMVRLEKDILTTGLHSRGFYDARIHHERKEAHITYHIDAGVPYNVRSVRVEAPEGIHVPEADELEIKQGAPLRAQAVLDAQSRIEKHIKQEHCLYIIKVDYTATVFHETQEAEIVFIVRPSEKAEFGDVKIAGAKTVEPAYVHLKVAFEKGDCFKRNLVEKSRLQMFQTGLFGSVESETELVDGQVNTIFHVTERKHRTIKAGAGYSSDEGLGLTGGWEHRNFFGEAEKLEVDAKISQITYSFGSKLSFPAFKGDPKQTLTFSGSVAQENPDAYESNTISAGVALKRQLTEKISGSIGTVLQLSTVVDAEGEETYGLVSFPVSLTFDNRDDVLNPTKGLYLTGEVRPFLDVLDQESNFLKSSATAITYHTLEDMQYEPTFALRGRVGSIQGVSTRDIPADERYYAGGGGSVRGYPYQKLGPLNDALEPTGGRSIAELSLETRLRFSEEWGGVLFVDGGNAYTDYIPDLGEGLRWGAGFGVRYFTSFAPIRMDVAFPLERRNAIDDTFQFYISIGQAF